MAKFKVGAYLLFFKIILNFFTASVLKEEQFTKSENLYPNHKKVYRSKLFFQML